MFQVHPKLRNFEPELLGVQWDGPGPDAPDVVHQAHVCRHGLPTPLPTRLFVRHGSGLLARAAICPRAGSGCWPKCPKFCPFGLRDMQNFSKILSVRDQPYIPTIGGPVALSSICKNRFLTAKFTTSNARASYRLSSFFRPRLSRAVDDVQKLPNPVFRI